MIYLMVEINLRLDKKRNPEIKLNINSELHKAAQALEYMEITWSYYE